jgi:hypothetical protein
MKEKRKRRPRKQPPLKPYDESDEAGILRFVRFAFRKAVEKTGPVVVFVMVSFCWLSHHRT